MESKRVTSQSKFSEAIGFTSARSVLAGLVLLVLVYWFLSGEMYRFYASVLFSFYALTEKMWVSVILLGVFQTLVLIPFRIVRVAKSQHIREFKEEVEELDKGLGISRVKQDFSFGNFTFLFYLVDFLVQLTTFLTIGRLFLTDFYTKLLREGVLYSGVHYPDYPIRGTFFKLPYIGVAKTVDLGLGVVVLFWLVVLLVLLAIWVVKYVWRRVKERRVETERMMATRYYYGYVLVLFGLSYVLIRHLPVEFEFRLFVGDVSRPNRMMNTITAVMTFLTLVWFGYRKILRKVKLAREMGVGEKVIEKTEKKMFSQSVKDASVVGVGAFFVTNHIPSAFELSVFTLEIISLLSPLTLDKLILAGSKRVKEKKVPIESSKAGESKNGESGQEGEETEK